MRYDHVNDAVEDNYHDKDMFDWNSLKNIKITMVENKYMISRSFLDLFE